MQARKATKTRPRGSRRGGRKRGLGGTGNALVPPPFIPTLKLSHKFRYLNGTSAGSFNITRGNLLNTVLYTPTAMTSVRLFQAVRLKKVEIWANPQALGAAPTVLGLEWVGENAPSTQISDNPMGVRPAYIRALPPPSSSNRWWSINGTSESDQLFSLILPANCVIDVTLELRLVENESPTAGDVPAGAVVGRLYGNYLDGLVSGSLVPQGFAILP